MRIAMLISQTPPIASGVARIADRLSRGLQEQGHMVEVFSAAELPQVFLGEFRFLNVLPLFDRVVERAPYDIINIHGPVPTFSDVLLLLCSTGRHRLGGSRIVYSHHWDVDISKMTAPLTWAYNILTRVLARCADQVVVSSAAYHRTFPRYLPSERCSIIPLGMDDCFLHMAVPPKADEFTILYAGQLRPYKGADILLRASTHLRDSKVIIAGDGYCRERYLRLAEKWALQNVSFEGRVSDEELRRLYTISHVVVLPSVSRLEAFGLVLLEGMGAGCVPVASQLPGVAETVGDAGLTFEVGDADGLAHILQLLKADRPLLDQLSYRALKRARTYSWDATCRAYSNAFADLVQPVAAETLVQHAHMSFLMNLRFPIPL